MDSNQSIQDHALETMPDSESRQIEDRLWWVRGRKAIIRRFMDRITGRGTSINIMDIGCGSGGNLDVLREYGKVIGVEPSATLARRARERRVAEAVFEQDALELDECRNMQVFTMFDVLEHIEDDKAFLSQLRRKAPQGHTLLVSVPACQFLYSDHDRILHHYRRYSDKTLRTLLEESGYEVKQMNYFLSLLFPLVLLARLKERVMARFGRKTETVEIGDFPAIISVPFEATLRIEAFLSRTVRFPIGLWLFAVARVADKNRPAE